MFTSIDAFFRADGAKFMVDAMMAAMVNAKAGLAEAPSSTAYGLYVLVLALAGDADLAVAVATSAAHDPALVAWIALHRALLLAAKTSKALQGPYFANIVLEFEGFNDHIAAIVKTAKTSLSAKASFLGASELDNIRMAILLSNVAIEVVRVPGVRIKTDATCHPD